MLPGDGIGVEVTAAAVTILRAVERAFAEPDNRTRDSGGALSTRQLTELIKQAVLADEA